MKAKFKNTVRQTNIQYFLLMIFFLIKRIRQHNTSKCANYLFPACFCVPCTSCAFIVSNIQLVLDLKHFLPPPFLIIFISKIIYSNKKIFHSQEEGALNITCLYITPLYLSNPLFALELAQVYLIS